MGGLRDELMLASACLFSTQRSKDSILRKMFGGSSMLLVATLLLQHGAVSWPGKHLTQSRMNLESSSRRLLRLGTMYMLVPHSRQGQCFLLTLIRKQPSIP